MRISWKMILIGLIASCLAGCGGTFQVGVLNATDPAVTQTLSASPGVAATITASGTSAAQAVTLTPQPSATPGQVLTPGGAITAPPASPTATPCAAPAKWATYTVKPGDTLFDLSQQTNVGVQQLRQANCLASDIIRAGQLIFLPYVPTPTYTPTATYTPTPPLPTVDPGAVFSPNGSFYATNTGVVVDTVQRRVVTDLLNPVALSVWRWSNDSRFVIFGRKNQFNSTYTYIFDTILWKLVYSTNGCTIQPNNTALTDTCGDYPFMLEANSDRLLLENGVLIDLASLRTLDLLADERPAQLSLLAGNWSPGEVFLAWVAADTSRGSQAVYLASGDGSQSRLITFLDGPATSLQWLTGTTVKVTTAGSVYIVDATGGTLAVTPAATVTPAPTISPTP